MLLALRHSIISATTSELNSSQITTNQMELLEYDIAAATAGTRLHEHALTLEQTEAPVL